jgi:hypothetical protein
MKSVADKHSFLDNVRQLRLASDVELAHRVLADLETIYPSIFFYRSAWWWRPAPDSCALLPWGTFGNAIRAYDGAPYFTPSGRTSRLRLSYSRVRSIEKEAAEQRWRSWRSPEGRLAERCWQASLETIR